MGQNNVSYDLHWLDYVIFSVVLLVNAGVGIYFAFTGGRQKTTKEYFTGNLGVIPSSLSIVVTFMSAIMIIGVPAETYLYGGSFILAAIGTGLGTLCSALFIVPILYPLRLVSNNKYLEIRYKSKLPKYLATCQSVLIGVVFSAVVIYAPCSAIATLTDIPVWAIILLSSIVSIFYTSIGGIKAVIWTDVFLCVCMLAGMFMISIQGIIKAGGLEAAWNLSLEGNRVNIFDFDLNPAVRMTVWNLVFAVAFDSTGTYGFSQSVVMRYSNVGSLRKAQITVLLSFAGNVFMFLLPVTSGLAIYAYYARIGCDPLKAGIIDGPNNLVPHFVMETLNYPGIPGIFLASMFAGALSSVSSSLNSATANLWDDVLKHIMPKSVIDKGALMSKIIVVILGCLSSLLCFCAILYGGTVFQLSYSLAGTILVPLNGMFILGMCCPWINDKGVLIAGVTGFFAILWICMGQFYTETYKTAIIPTDISNCSMDVTTISPFQNTSSFTDHSKTTTSLWNTTIASQDDDSGASFFKWLYSISYLWYRCIGVFIMFIVATIISLITGFRNGRTVNSSLVCCCYKICKKETKMEDSSSWTADEFYSVKKPLPEDQSLL